MMISKEDDLIQREVDIDLMINILLNLLAKKYPNLDNEFKTDL